MFRAACVELLSDNVRVTSPLENETLALPAIASSTAVPRLVLVTTPHVLRFSPVVIN